MHDLEHSAFVGRVDSIDLYVETASCVVLAPKRWAKAAVVARAVSVRARQDLVILFNRDHAVAVAVNAVDLVATRILLLMMLVLVVEHRGSLPRFPFLDHLVQIVHRFDPRTVRAIVVCHLLLAVEHREVLEVRRFPRVGNRA